MGLVRIVELPRIEGHLDIEIEISGDDVKVKAMAREGTRILNKLLEGREYSEVPNIVSRMCGVCSVIHRVTSVLAIESALGVTPPDSVLALRELITIGGHIQSHLIHLFYFVLPDVLGVDSIVRIIDKNPELVRNIMRIKSFANNIVETFCGRAVHPIVSVCEKSCPLPSKDKAIKILSGLKALKNLALALSRVILEAKLPDIPCEENFISLAGSGSIHLLSGSVATPNGTIEPQSFLEKVNFVIENYSTAPHFLYNGKAYMVGSLSRLNNNYSLIKGSAKDLMREFNLVFPSRSVFMNNKAQAIEIVYFLEKAEELLEGLIMGETPELQPEIKQSNGFGLAITEAPRGLLVHSYRLKKGRIMSANIITPTAQNLKSIEKNASIYAKVLLNDGFGLEDVKNQIEHLVRSYDPCISCAARFKRD